MNRLAPIIAGTLAALLLLLRAYMGSYYALLEEVRGSIVHYFGEPDYRINGMDSLLRPAHQIDRLIRPDYWHRTQHRVRGRISNRPFMH